MSILQQILDQMFVDPEILEALDEEQKQILFIKMREEQVKRWKAYEEKMEKENSAPKKPSQNSRRIQWLKGTDGEVWVWVMGEHKDDLSIEDMIEKRVLEEARQLAEKEMLESIDLSTFGNGAQDLYPSEDENTLKQQLSRMGVQGNGSGDNNEDFLYADADGVEPSAFTGSPAKPPEGGYRVASYGLHADGFLQNSKPSVNNHLPSETMNTEVSKAGDAKSPPVPTRPPRLRKAEPMNEAPKEVIIQRNGANGVPPPVVASTASPGQAIPSNRPRPAQAEKPAILTPKPKTTFAQASPVLLSQPSTSWETKSTTLPAKLDVSALNAPAHVKMRSATDNRVTAAGEDELSKRQSEIYEMIKEKRQKILKEAEREAERANHDWEEQERKAREAEAQIRRIAQKAREQHRQQSLRTSTSILPALKDTNALSLREAIKNLPRPPKPKSRQAIVDWFRVDELPRGTGLDPKTNLPAPWFHGIISREQADELLRNKPSGSFLVRISERIWGYTVSYVVGDGNTKHFLIERIPEGYQFLGTNQVVHHHLYDLITYHETAPITVKGNEILKWAVGQVSSPPDYSDVMVDAKMFSKQRPSTLPASFYRRV